MIHKLKLKRVYEAPHKDDGTRILVDRLWPRGLTKERAKVDLWLKEIAPSTELRRWFRHDPKKWRNFRQRYQTLLREEIAHTVATPSDIEDELRYLIAVVRA